uniref:Uncharacterized protein n=1 Tax=Caenorhabditis japonica TaxID=281687 RepID=A0A8R1ES65_CAEJA
MVDHKAQFFISRNDYPNPIKVPFRGKQTQRQVTFDAVLLISQIVGYELSNLWSSPTVTKTAMHRIFAKSKAWHSFTNTAF